MAYNEQLADRIREALVNAPGVEEKQMFGGVCFMVDGKMCVGVLKDDMMCRIGAEQEAAALEKNGCRSMDFTGRSMKGYVFVGEEGMRTKKAFDQWIHLCLAFNPLATATKKKPARRGKSAR